MTPTSGMNIAQRILHVGGRNNAAGYIEFGSIQAVEALVRQVLRDLPPADVPLLSDDEIYEMYSEPRSDAEMLEFGREVEAAVRKLFIAAPQAQPAVEPVAWMVRNGCVNYQLMGSKAQADALAAEMQKRHDLSGSLASFGVCPLYTAPQAQPIPLAATCHCACVVEDNKVVEFCKMHGTQQPRKAVKLTDDELDVIYRESFGLIDSRLVGDQIKFARAIEAAVLKKNGVTE